MLRAVFICLQSVSTDFCEEIEKNGVKTVILPRINAETDVMWRGRLETALGEHKITPEECLLLAEERRKLTVASGFGVKCIGYGNSEDLFGCCEYVIENLEGIGFSYITRVFHRLEGVPLVIAETENLIIRELAEADVPRLCEICSQASVRAYISDIGDDLRIEAEKHKAYIENAYCFYDYGYWGVYDRRSGELIGRCGIQDNLIGGITETEIGYLLAEEYRGKGYAKEAVQAVIAYAYGQLFLPRIVAVIDKENATSLHVAEHCGMRWEKDIVMAGRDCSVYVIGFTACG